MSLCFLATFSFVPYLVNFGLIMVDFCSFLFLPLLAQTYFFLLEQENSIFEYKNLLKCLYLVVNLWVQILTPPKTESFRGFWCKFLKLLFLCYEDVMWLLSILMDLFVMISSYLLLSWNQSHLISRIFVLHELTFEAWSTSEEGRAATWEVFFGKKRSWWVNVSWK